VTRGCRPHQTVTAVEDSVVKEVTDVLREWGIIWKRQFVVSHLSFVLIIM